MWSPENRRFVQHTLMVLGLGVVSGLIIGLLAGRNGMRARARLSMEGRDTVRAAVCFPAGLADRLGYAVGLEYALLKKFGEDEGVCMDILVSNPDSADRWAQLENEDLDILIVDASDSSWMDSEVKVKPCLRSGKCLWLVRKHDRRLLVNLNHWLGLFTTKKEFSELSSAFSYPWRMGAPEDTVCHPDILYRRISPYDDIIRQNARILGWDWRMLAALICQESRFVMSTVSRRDAIGLMQVRQVTADYYGVPLSFDPVENIHLGTLHLSRIQRMFPEGQYSLDDILKFSLAAYNCGEGRIKECISFALDHEYDGNKWDDVAEAISLMKADGLFNGRETLNFVQEIISRYEVYRATVVE